MTAGAGFVDEPLGAVVMNVDDEVTRCSGSSPSQLVAAALELEVVGDFRARTGEALLALAAAYDV